MKKQIHYLLPFLCLAMAVALVLIPVACQAADGQRQIPVTGGKIPYPIRQARQFDHKLPPEAPLQPAAHPAAAPVALFTAVDPQVGFYLADSEGMALYAYTADEPDFSNCGEVCLLTWYPLIGAEGRSGDRDVFENLIGSAIAVDGSPVVSYNHMPLYRYYGDLNPGDILGQGLDGAWFLVSPGGGMIRD